MQDFQDYPTGFRVFGHPTFSSPLPLPASGPQSGNTTIAVRGANFESTIAADRQCKFGLSTSAVVSPALLMDNTTLLCVSPRREQLLHETYPSRAEWRETASVLMILLLGIHFAKVFSLERGSKEVRGQQEPMRHVSRQSRTHAISS